MARERGLNALRRKSWQLVTLNRFFQKSHSRERVRVDDSANKQLSHDVKAELQLLHEEARSSGKLASGFATHNFHNGDSYKGNWKMGMMHGQGEFTYSNGNRYSGDWAENKRHGEGMFSNGQTGTRYEGQWNSDKRHGQGTFTDKEGNRYVGGWVNNDMAGKGRYAFINGDVYEGDFARNDFNGRGRFTYGNGDFYDGDWMNGQCHGQGKFTYPAIGHIYEGTWSQDKKQGRGRYNAPDYIYEGEWKDDAMCGMGEYKYPNGEKYVGEWLDNEEHGHGCFAHADGSKYDGYFSHGSRSGWGVFTGSDGSKYEGNWKDNVKSGQGTYTYPNGDKYSGGWTADQMHGTGVYSHRSGKKFNVEYDKGKNVKKERVSSRTSDDLASQHRPSDDHNNHYSQAYQQSLGSARGNSSLMVDNNSGYGQNEWQLDRLPQSPATLALTPGESRSASPAPPMSPNLYSARGQSDEERVKQFLVTARGNVAHLMHAIGNAEDADPTVADQARDDMQQGMKLMALSGIDSQYKHELSELSDQLAELLQMWDDALTQSQQNALPLIEKKPQWQIEQEEEAKRKEEQEKRRLEQERDSTKRKMEELRQKRKEQAEIQAMEKQLADIRKKRETEEVDEEQLEMQRKLKEQQDQIERLRQEANAARPNPQLEAIRKRIEDEQKARESAEKQKADRKLKRQLEQLEAEKQAAIDAEKRVQEERAARELELMKEKMKREYEQKVGQFEEKFKEENKAPDGREEVERAIQSEFQQRLEELQTRLAAATAGPDKPLASEQQVAEMKRLKELYEKEQYQRRKLYNELADLKGNLRCYVRPKDNGDGKDSLAIPTDEMLTVVGDKKKFSFEFEKVFTPGVSTDSVFADTAPIVSGVLEGSSVAILAYGAKGTGKTYSMMGSADSEGIIPRALKELFKLIHDRSERDEVQAKMGAFEIKNESITDLQKGSSGLQVGTDDSGTVVVGLTMSPVEEGREADAIFGKAQRARSPDTHFVIVVSLDVKNLQSGAKTKTKLFLADLRSSQTNDASLSNLGEVFLGVSKKSKSIAYNNSQLTHALKDGLMAKSLMLLTVSSAFADQADALSTLQFANYCRAVVEEKKKK